jgi:hypothetical protein
MNDNHPPHGDQPCKIDDMTEEQYDAWAKKNWQLLLDMLNEMSDMGVCKHCAIGNVMSMIGGIYKQSLPDPVPVALEQTMRAFMSGYGVSVIMMDIAKEMTELDAAEDPPLN